MNKKQIGWYCENGGKHNFTPIKPTHITTDVWVPAYIDVEEQTKLRESRDTSIQSFIRKMNEWRELDIDSDEYVKIINRIAEGAAPYKTTNNQRSFTYYYLIDGVKYRTDDFDVTFERYYGTDE